MTQTPKSDIRFIVDVQPKTDSYSGRSLNLTVTPVVVDEAGKIRNPDSDSDYADLRVEGHLYEVDNDFYFGTDIVTFDIYRLSARRAENVVKTFRRLAKRFAAQDAKWGRPSDSADILIRLADAVGATSPCPFGRTVSRSGWSYDDNEYRWLDTDGLRSYLASQIKDWKGDES